LTLDPTQPGPPKTENFVTQPDPTRPNPTHGWIRPMSNSDSTSPSEYIGIRFGVEKLERCGYLVVK